MDYLDLEDGAKIMENLENPKNLLEIYGDRKGNLTTKTFYKCRWGCLPCENQGFREWYGAKNKLHSFDVSNEELIDEPNSGRTIMDALDVPASPEDSIPCTKLLQGVEKFYDKGVKLLDASENPYSQAIRSYK